jgi:hypothetical protein
MTNCDYTMTQHFITPLGGEAVFPLSECAC